MMESKTSLLKDFGDFQTPPLLVERILQRLGSIGKHFSRVLEPTCGEGTFIQALLHTDDPPEEIIGLEIQENYYNEALKLEGKSSIKLTIRKANIFEQDLGRDLPWKTKGGLLVIGNPPWITNSALGSLGSKNLPQKENFKNLRGINAITGGSNFDITEYIWLKLIRELASQKPTIALLCKTSVARNVLEFAAKSKLPISNARIYKIDAKKWFEVATDACLFYMKVGTKKPDYKIAVYADLGDKKPQSVISVVDGSLVANAEGYSRTAFMDGISPLTWRQGLKHDAASVMELTQTPGGSFVNALGEVVDVEREHLYPLAKSSDLFNQRYSSSTRAVLVTQHRLNDDTADLENRAPKFWKYLTSHNAIFERRKSSIYVGKPPYSMFGIGDYSFSPYKVAISGFYKTPIFRAVGSIDGRPVMLDDTCYFIPCATAQSAALFTALLNDPRCREFLDSTMFLDSKRPITKKLLQRIDLIPLLNAVNKQELIFRAEKLLEQLGVSAVTVSWPASLESFITGENDTPLQLNLVA